MKGDEDRFVGQVFLLHVLEDVAHLDEVLHRGRHLLRVLRKGGQRTVLEIGYLELAATLVLFRRVRKVNEVAAYRATRSVAVSFTLLPVHLDGPVETPEHHRSRKRCIDNVQAHARRPYQTLVSEKLPR